MTGDNWVEKHRPESFSDVQGNNKALNRIENWARNWEKGDEALLLYGPPGVGKTTTAFIVADVMEAAVNQINASDARKTEDIERIVDEMVMRGVDGEKQLIFIDEVDSWYHSVSAKPLADALENPVNPVIMAVNDTYETPDSITNHSNVESIEFKLSKSSRKAKLKEIAEKEGIDLNTTALNKLADRKDLRAAINDLQMLNNDGSIEYDSRVYETNEFDAITEVMKGNEVQLHDVTPDTWINWLTDNVRRSYTGKEAVYAYDALSHADISLGRVNRTQNYHYWKWASEIMDLVPGCRIRDDSKGWWKDTFPNWFRSKAPKNEYGGEYTLFQKLKDSEDHSFRMSGNFPYFRKVILPLIRQQDEAVRYEFALNAGLYVEKHEAAIEALDLNSSDYESWVEEEKPEKGEWTPDEADALSW